MDPWLKKELGVFGPVLEWNENRIFAQTPDAQLSFFDTASFPWIAEVESHWRGIRAELDCLLERRHSIPPFQKVSTLQEVLTTDEHWRTYVFRVYGWDIRDAHRSCPETSAALRAIPGMSLAMFSILEPGKRLPPHRGPHKGVLRYHLGVKVPTSDVERCGIRVGDEQRGWVEGRSLVFDDTHDHQAWNDTDQIRVVLFVDFPRPLPPVLAATNWALGKAAQFFSPDVHEARINSKRYARAFRR